MRTLYDPPVNERTPTEKQEQFCLEYIIDLDLLRAYRAAYPKATLQSAKAKSFQLFEKPFIQRRIRTLKIERADRLKLTADSVLLKIIEVVDRCMQAEPVFGADGEVTGEWVFKEAGALRGLELLGKHMALWVERYQVSNPIQEILAKKLDALSPDEIRQFVTEFKRIKELADADRIQPARN